MKSKEHAVIMDAAAAVVVALMFILCNIDAFSYVMSCMVWYDIPGMVPGTRYLMIILE